MTDARYTFKYGGDSLGKQMTLGSEDQMIMYQPQANLLVRTGTATIDATNGRLSQDGKAVVSPSILG